MHPHPLPALDALAFSKLRIHETTPTEGTGKRKVDGSYADTRLGKALTPRWANERFRQVMMLVREFRTEWPTQSLLSNDDVEFILRARCVSRSCWRVVLLAAKFWFTGDDSTMAIMATCPVGCCV